MPFSLSTSWNAFRHSSGEEMLEEILALGFTGVELSFNLTRSMVDGVKKAAGEGRVRVSSVHNYCPVPDGMERHRALPDCYSMSSPDREERAAAVKFAKRSIDTAAELNAAAVVLHCGRVEMPDRTRDLIAVCRRGERESALFCGTREAFIREREQAAGVFFSNALRSLEELDAYASRLKIRLGIENRFYYREIPSFEETGEIFRRFGGSSLCFWYDTGHGRIMEDLGFAAPDGFLGRYSRILGGLHLHNVKDFQDHLPPSADGDIDFRLIAGEIRQCPVRVIEAHHPAAGESVSGSRSFLERIIDAQGAFP